MANSPFPAVPKGTILDLGRAIKAKYPQYAQLPDADLGKMAREKYPDAYGQFLDVEPATGAPMPGGMPPSPPPPAITPEPMGMIDTVLGMGGATVRDVAEPFRAAATAPTPESTPMIEAARREAGERAVSPFPPQVGIEKQGDAIAFSLPTTGIVPDPGVAAIERHAGELGFGERAGQEFTKAALMGPAMLIPGIPRLTPTPEERARSLAGMPPVGPLTQEGETAVAGEMERIGGIDEMSRQFGGVDAPPPLQPDVAETMARAAGESLFSFLSPAALATMGGAGAAGRVVKVAANSPKVVAALKNSPAALKLLDYVSENAVQMGFVGMAGKGSIEEFAAAKQAYEAGDTEAGARHFTSALTNAAVAVGAGMHARAKMGEVGARRGAAAEVKTGAEAARTAGEMRAGGERLTAEEFSRRASELFTAERAGGGRGFEPVTFEARGKNYRIEYAGATERGRGGYQLIDEATGKVVSFGTAETVRNRAESLTGRKTTSLAEQEAIVRPIEQKIEAAEKIEQAIPKVSEQLGAMPVEKPKAEPITVRKGKPEPLTAEQAQKQAEAQLGMPPVPTPAEEEAVDERTAGLLEVQRKGARETPIDEIVGPMPLEKPSKPEPKQEVAPARPEPVTPLDIEKPAVPSPAPEKPLAVPGDVKTVQAVGDEQIKVSSVPKKSTEQVTQDQQDSPWIVASPEKREAKPSEIVSSPTGLEALPGETRTPIAERVRAASAAKENDSFTKAWDKGQVVNLGSAVSGVTMIRSQRNPPNGKPFDVINLHTTDPGIRAQLKKLKGVESGMGTTGPLAFVRVSADNQKEAKKTIANIIKRFPPSQDATLGSSTAESARPLPAYPPKEDIQAVKQAEVMPPGAVLAARTDVSEPTQTDTSVQEPTPTGLEALPSIEKPAAPSPARKPIPQVPAMEGMTPLGIPGKRTEVPAARPPVRFEDKTPQAAVPRTLDLTENPVTGEWTAQGKPVFTPGTTELETPTGRAWVTRLKPDEMVIYRNVPQKVGQRTFYSLVEKEYDSPGRVETRGTIDDVIGRLRRFAPEPTGLEVLPGETKPAVPETKAPVAETKPAPADVKTVQPETAPARPGGTTIEAGERPDAGKPTEPTARTPAMAQPDSPVVEGAKPEAGERVEGERPTRTTADERGEADGRPDVRDGDRQQAPKEPRTGDRRGDVDAPVKRERVRETISGDNYRISDADQLGAGGPVAKARGNIEAIRTAKKIASEGRTATAEEKAALVKYVGWGGLPGAVGHPNWNDPDRDQWYKIKEEVKELLGSDELEAARTSTLNAHYTSPQVVSFVWDAVRRLGITADSRILEPAAGTGNFIGLMPEDLAAGSRVVGIELDPITAMIASQLYGGTKIHNAGFQSVALPNNFFDLAISNVPFGKYGVFDRAFQKNPEVTRSIHDYFFAKALEKVRPGGIVAFITSRYTLDKSDPVVRNYLAGRADFLGAVRLPDTAFKASAGTEVVTDVIFLRKRLPEANEAGESWVDVSRVKVGDSEYLVNSYFTRHSEMVLGEESEEGSMYRGGDYTVKGALTPGILEKALKRLPENMVQPWERVTPKREVHVSDLPGAGDVKQGGFVVRGGKLYVRVGEQFEQQRASAKDIGIIQEALKVRDAARAVFRTQLLEQGEAAIVKARDALNAEYDKFTKKHGPLTKRTNYQAFSDDPDAPLLASLENYNPKTGKAVKTKVFTERTVHTERRAERVSTAAEALVVSLNETGRVDWDVMTRVSARDVKTLQAELAGDQHIFLDPESDEWATSDQYLSGNVRRRLKVAKAAAEVDPKYQGNVDALETVQPEDVPLRDIRVRLGVNWLPEEVLTEFVNQITGQRPYYGDAKVTYIPALGIWKVTISDKYNATNETTWGTSDYRADQLLESALNQRQITVRREMSDGSTIVDTKATLVAREKVDKINEKLQEWLQADEARAKAVERVYNDRFNNLQIQEFDGSHLTFPGMNKAFLRDGDLDAHQKNAVWRALSSGNNTLLAHVVGAGKTFEFIAAVMEMRRLGLARKPMIVVPNHRIEGTAADFLRLYPAANILALGRTDLAKKKRQQVMARIATGNYDAVIVPQSSFGFLPVSDERKMKFFEDQLRLVEQSYLAAKDGDFDKRVVKQLAAAKERLKVKLQKMAADQRKDKALSFEELGIDMLVVDESQDFKNLYFPTKMGNVSGIQSQEVQKSFDLWMKTQYINEITNERGVIFATGTPIANTMGEMYTVARYLQPKWLEESGLNHFDDWASNFGRTVTEAEVSATGSGYQMKTRFSRFVNVSEMTQAFRLVADIKMAEDLDLPRPKLKGDKPIVVTAPTSPELKAYVQTLVKRAEAIKGRKVEKGGDNMLVITTDGRKAATDMRLVDPRAKDNPDSKVNIAIDTIHSIWERTAAERSTQIVFLDISVPTGDDRWNLYTDIRGKLIKAGVPENEIAFIHDHETDAKKTELFRAVNDGDVRILMGNTERMGTGVNVQTRVKALHHLDAPWRPDWIEQREGRAWRQGNTNAEIEIYRYVTKGSFDVYMWQALQRKAKFIAQALKSGTGVRELEDVDAFVLTASEVIAAGSDNPLVMEKIVTDSKLAKLDALRSDFQHRQRLDKGNVERLPRAIEIKEKSLTAARKDAALIEKTKGQPFEITIGKRVFGGKDARKDAAEALEKVLKSWDGSNINNELGFYRGMQLRVLATVETGRKVIWTAYPALRGIENLYKANRNENSPEGTLKSLEYQAEHGPAENVERIERELSSLQGLLEESGKRLKQGFAEEQEYQELTARRREIAIELGLEKGDDTVVDDAGGDDTPETPSAAAPKPERYGPESGRIDVDLATLGLAPLARFTARQTAIAWGWVKGEAGTAARMAARERKQWSKDASGLFYTAHMPSYIAEMQPEFAPFYNRARHGFQEKNDIVSELHGMLGPYYKLSNEDRAELDRRLIRARRKKTNEIADINDLNDEQKAAAAAVRDTFEEALTKYESLAVDMATRGQLTSARGLDTLDEIKNALLAAGIPDKAADRSAAKLKGILDDIREAKKAGYVPFSRFGDWEYGIVPANDPEARPIQWERKESRRAADKRTEWMRQHYSKALASGDYRLVEPHKSNKQVRAGALPGLGAAELWWLERIAQLDPQHEVELKEAIIQVQEAARKLGFRSHFTSSKEVPGYETDLKRPIADYVVGLASHISRTRMFRDMETYYGGIPARKARLKAYADDYVKYLREPQSELAWMRSGIFHWYLGFMNLKSAMVNLTQVPLVSFPWLTQYASAGRVAAELARAQKDVLKISDVKGFQYSRLPRDVRADAIASLEDGTLQAQFARELGDIAHGRAKNPLWQGALNVSALPFQTSEHYNRLVTFVAAHRLFAHAKERHGLRNAMEFAENAVDHTQYEYAAYNRAKWGRGKMAPLAVFKSFGVNYFETWLRLLHRGAGGTGGRKPNRRALWAAAAMLALLVMASGYWGLPGVGEVADLYTVYQHWAGEKYDPEIAVQEIAADLTGPEVADVMGYGITRMTPFDLSGSLGQGRPVGVGAAARAAVGIGDIGDVTAITSLVGRAGKGVRGLAQGSVRAAESVAPTSIANVLKADRMAERGVRTRGGRQLPLSKTGPHELTGLEVAGQAMGFTPTRVSRAYQEDWRKQQLGGSQAEIKAALILQVAEAIVDGDMARRNRALGELRERKIPFTADQIKQKVRFLKMPPVPAAMRQVPKAHRKEASQSPIPGF